MKSPEMHIKFGQIRDGYKDLIAGIFPSQNTVYQGRVIHRKACCRRATGLRRLLCGQATCDRVAESVFQPLSLAFGTRMQHQGTRRKEHVSWIIAGKDIDEGKMFC